MEHRRCHAAQIWISGHVEPAEGSRELTEEPRATEAPTTDDHTRSAGLHHHALGMAVGPDVTVAENGHAIGLELLDQASDGGPVGLTSIEL